MSQLNSDDVRKVADLAMLEFTDDQISALVPQLSRVLDYVEMLAEVDTAGVEPLAHPIELTNAFREDEPTPMLPREQALKNAPQTDGAYFIVPAILDGGGE